MEEKISFVTTGQGENIKLNHKEIGSESEDNEVSFILRLY
jgi:hypothetical protein